MYLVYVDESGTFNKNDPSENFVLAGFVISEHDWRRIDDCIKEAKKKHFPELEDIEIHMVDIIHGKCDFQGKDIKKRIEFLEEICKIMQESEIKTFCIVMKKEHIFTTNLVFNRAYEYLYERIAWNIQYLNNQLVEAGEPSQSAIVFLDGQEEGKILQMIRTKVRELIFTGSSYDHNKKIIEDPIFSNSKWRGNIQLADTIAYAFNYINNSNKKSHKAIHDILLKIEAVAHKKMIDPSPVSPAYCYKIWPKKP
ncbi:MAG: DUF3800 domain-containing protein [Candidatus Nanoarchaeia archaeon]|jgi:hypothetical protein